MDLDADAVFAQFSGGFTCLKHSEAEYAAATISRHRQIFSLSPGRKDMQATDTIG